MTTETETAFAELLGAVGATHARMVEQLADDETTLLEAHKWILSILQVAAEVQLWADTARPRFVEIVGPYKKWGGDNADAFYCYAPIDPARTYRVTIHPGDAVYLSLTVYGGPDDGRYSERIVGTVNSRDAPDVPTGPSTSCCRPTSRPSPTSPGSGWSPTRWPPSPATTWRTRERESGRAGTSRPTTPRRSTARTTPTWRGACGP